MMNGRITYPFLNGFFYVDALSVIVLDTIVLISFMACIYSIGYLNEEYKHGKLDLKKMKVFYSLTYAFIFTMTLVVTTQNLGLMWIAIEATTLASAFLVGFYNNKYSIEAAWKYIIICSVGIAFALLGIVLLHLSSLSVSQEAKSQLNWLFLFNNASKPAEQHIENILYIHSSRVRDKGWPCAYAYLAPRCPQSGTVTHQRHAFEESS